jgi:hypothetical protein
LKLAVSNIAWSFEDRIEAYKILQDSGIRGLEIAPTLLFQNAVSNKVDLSDTDTITSIKQLHDFQLQLVSMQSVLYGAEFAKLFAGEESLIVFENTMREAISLAGKTLSLISLFGLYMRLLDSISIVNSRQGIRLFKLEHTKLLDRDRFS